MQQAFRAGWLGDETAWLQMLRDRNETSHTYNEILAIEVVAFVRQEGVVLLASLLARLKEATP